MPLKERLARLGALVQQCGWPCFAKGLESIDSLKHSEIQAPLAAEPEFGIKEKSNMSSTSWTSNCDLPVDSGECPTSQLSTAASADATSTSVSLSGVNASIISSCYGPIETEPTGGSARVSQACCQSLVLEEIPGPPLAHGSTPSVTMRTPATHDTPGSGSASLTTTAAQQSFRFSTLDLQDTLHPGAPSPFNTLPPFSSSTSSSPSPFGPPATYSPPMDEVVAFVSDTANADGNSSPCIATGSSHVTLYRRSSSVRSLSGECRETLLSSCLEGPMASMSSSSRPSANFVTLVLSSETMSDVLQQRTSASLATSASFCTASSLADPQQQQLLAAPAASGEDVTVDPQDLLIHHDSVLGSGQFSTVYRGEYCGTPCAVKVLERCVNEELETFTQELSVILSMSHPNVVRYYGGSRVPPQVYVVEELMQGTLSDLLYGTPQQHLSRRQVLSIGLDIARGLQYIHGLSPPLIHRDLKPDNILMDSESRAKISDFGLSRSKYQSCLKTARRSAGTMAYMAPECFDVSVGRLTEQCDVFSFGVVMWEMCTGSRPWEGVRAQDFLQRMVVDGARLSMPYDDNVCPMALRNLISHCWCTDPDERVSCDGIVRELERMLKFCW